MRYLALIAEVDVQAGLGGRAVGGRERGVRARRRHAALHAAAAAAAAALQHTRTSRIRRQHSEPALPHGTPHHHTHHSHRNFSTAAVILKDILAEIQSMH